MKLPAFHHYWTCNDICGLHWLIKVGALGGCIGNYFMNASTTGNFQRSIGHIATSPHMHIWQLTREMPRWEHCIEVRMTTNLHSVYFQAIQKIIFLQDQHKICSEPHIYFLR